MARPTLTSLPDELLLLIGSHIVHSTRNTTLCNLSLVSRRFRPIAQEWLLRRPRFNLTYIDAYMWSIAHRPHLLPQIRSLEVWSTSAGRIERFASGFPVRRYAPVRCPAWLGQRRGFLEKCREIVWYYARGAEERMYWAMAMEVDVVAGLFGVLLCVLPGLRELKLGGGWLMDFPVLSNMLAEGPARLHVHLPGEWKKRFLAAALEEVRSRLQVLELPADMSALWFGAQVDGVFDFRGFGALKEIGLTMRALGDRGFRFFNPSAVFPPSLEILRISEATYDTTSFLETLCLAKRASCFPNLCRIEVYYMNKLELVQRKALAHRCLSPIQDAGIVCLSAKLSLRVYFPGHELQTWVVGGTPWSLREEGLARLREAERKALKLPIADVWFPVLELEWNEQGHSLPRQQ